MELDELQERLPSFCAAHFDGAVGASEVWKMPGHAGFSYGFAVEEGDATSRWFLRLPPPGVQHKGTADVLRQVAVLNALDGTDVPHCSVRWSGTDEQWFGRPYFVVPVLDGDVARIEDGGWTRDLDPEARRAMADSAMRALAGLHAVDHRAATIDGEPYLGEPVDLVTDVERWDRFVEKSADPERLVLVPEVRGLLLDNRPADPQIGIFHGDFQWGNLFFANKGDNVGELLAVIDFELTGAGATCNDVGWIATFNDPRAWGDNRTVGEVMPQADELVDMYRRHSDDPCDHIEWFRALAAYKFAIISGFNLMLHRRGKRHDPLWEDSKHSIEPLLERARTLLSC